MAARHIVLVGLPGAGKTTVGRLVAGRLAATFHDVDGIIEDEASLTIPRIFAEKEEAGFRALETRTVDRLLAGTPAVIAPGGGWAAQTGNLEAARAAGAFLVYLVSSPDAAAQRTAGESHRPLLTPQNPLPKLRELLAVRESYYQQSDLAVTTDGREAGEVAEEVLEAVRDRAGW